MQALRALADRITPCPVCNPDRDLGWQPVRLW
ncbi:DUF6233 domain-containing protein [Streptomyces sp. ISL-99]